MRANKSVFLVAAISATMLLAGCNVITTVPVEDVKAALSFCKENGGVESVQIDGGINKVTLVTCRDRAEYKVTYIRYRLEIAVPPVSVSAGAKAPKKTLAAPCPAK